MSKKNFIVSQVQQAQLQSARIAAAHGLNAFKTKFFTVPDSIGAADDEDALDGLPSASSSNDSNTRIGNSTKTTYLLNSLVYDTVTFMGSGNGDITYYDLASGQPKTAPKMQIPIALCTVTKNIKVVATEIAGRNGSVKQYINTGDYDVVIRGIFTTGVSDKYPTSAMKDLQKITDASSEVKVASTFLQLFGINYLVFTKCEFDQADDEGRDIQKFTLTCISETPFAIDAQQGSTTSNVTTANLTTTKQ